MEEQAREKYKRQESLCWKRTAMVLTSHSLVKKLPRTIEVCAFGMLKEIKLFVYQLLLREAQVPRRDFMLSHT